MKTERIKLYDWESFSENIEIDWPKVHKTLGTDYVDWVLKQSVTDCQFVVDKIRDKYSLVLEIYNDNARTLYHLMWAK